jgi:D-aspartate ligase
MKNSKRRAIIIGDSTNNTLSIVRSLGEVGISQTLILKCDADISYVCKSKYLKSCSVYHIKLIKDCLPILLDIKDEDGEKFIICSFDEAAIFIDNNEDVLHDYFVTPARGKQIGELFNKDKQCLLAKKCGLTVPESVNFSLGENIDDVTIAYPILLKPLNSTKGEKSDIHICHDKNDFEKALANESSCRNFIIQKFIEKEYEIDCIGVRTDKETYLAGGIRKIRHYPPLIGAGAYGLFMPIEKFDINVEGVNSFLEESNYHGPFSVEFLHAKDGNYFMEVNFRNEGLAYASTVAGANLHALYIYPQMKIRRDKIRKIYMMNYSIDFLYVKSGEISLLHWMRDFLRTKCFININLKDLMPTICYYKNKLRHKLVK